ncbi:Response regulator receiver domain-containing protein [Arenibacter nanhaiticus]|uniref:Response regulator receiver domain-containing protein n=1 Tax=Arenibacter nanhaiticus TaxID=558155 RepID=A0A1M6BWF9_9FLAO|nr:response regulator [Arenibacter nanhaiticus]SHI53090.1 Response regulator receiver domain-containing protein [Arenibacter nanhaiticus]
MLESKSKFQRVMIIDDNPMDLYITARLITKHNFGEKIDQYQSAIKALEFLQEKQCDLHGLPQVIFLDIFMPKMTGFEFMAEYDKLSSGFKKQCRVYMVSSSIDPNDIKRANEDLNVVAFHVKSITKEFLDNIL